MKIFCRVLIVATLAATAVAGETADPYLWLEDVESQRSMDWVHEQNAQTFESLRQHPLYDELYDEALAILTAKERLPDGIFVGSDFHDFWQDEQHVRGIWRRTPIDALIAGEFEWEVLLDIDELAAAEDENWVYKGIDCVGGQSDRCLVELSIGGKDESIYREFSLSERAFVEAGFYVPEAKSYVDWLDEDTLLVATDWGDGSLTNSGYPREVRQWSRGTPIRSSRFLYKIDTADTLVGPTVFESAGRKHAFLVHYLEDWNDTYYVPIVDGKARERLRIPLRVSVEGVLDGHAILNLEQDWRHAGTQYRRGDIVALAQTSDRSELVFSPAESQAVTSVEIGQSGVYIELLDNVIGKILRVRRVEGAWQAEALDLPQGGVALLAATSSGRDDLLVSFESSVQPTTLYHVDAANELERIAALPPLYDATGVVIRQAFATSRDGVAVPYFLIGHEDVLRHGNAPTILYGYGGFLAPVLPVYYADPARPQHGALAGRMWVSRGGVLALANLRGGGEFGPRWHQAALRENRQRAFDDYIAIAEDLIETGVTSSDKLGALGRSNGGLLLGVALTQRPDLFAAMDIGVPLLDMRRYSKLLAGASWMGEYGNPDVPEDWAYISKYSPYQKLVEGRDYPAVLFYTSTKDDRVHPGHARKMAAKLDDMGYDFFYYENVEGGHGGTANQQQLAMRTALEYAYFARMLMPSLWDDAARTD